MPHDLQNAQAARDETLTMMPGCATARSADFVSYVRGATQNALQVSLAPHEAYAQQPNFVLPKSDTIPSVLLPGYHEAFGIDLQPPVGYSDTTQLPLEVFEQRIHAVFSNVKAEKLREAGDQLTDNMQCLKTHIQRWGESTVTIHFRCVSVLALRFLLGFTIDDDSSKEQRMRFWNQVNIAWLTTLQHQHDLVREMRRTKQSTRSSDVIISARKLEQLGEGVVSFCNDVQEYGLVDYQMGFWEEQIMERECS
jgi:hypothetical protein